MEATHLVQRFQVRSMLVSVLRSYVGGQRPVSDSRRPNIVAKDFLGFTDVLALRFALRFALRKIVMMMAS
jgi:hypothetical protein